TTASTCFPVISPLRLIALAHPAPALPSAFPPFAALAEKDEGSDPARSKKWAGDVIRFKPRVRGGKDGRGVFSGPEHLPGRMPPKRDLQGCSNFPVRQGFPEPHDPPPVPGSVPDGGRLATGPGTGNATRPRGRARRVLPDQRRRRPQAAGRRPQAAGR